MNAPSPLMVTVEPDLNERGINRGLSPFIRSFVRRQGRLTPAQQRALTTAWRAYGVEVGVTPLDFTVLFGRQAPLVLEIGFGDGQALVTMASSNPREDYLGLEVYRPGIGHLLLRAEAMKLPNIRIICADAVEVLQQQIRDECLDRIQIFFPDPWPKRRHRKRRLLQAPFVSLLVQKLKVKGQLHIATDCADYAGSILAVLSATPGLINQASNGGFMPRSQQRPVTKFEERGLRLGHPIWELLFARSRDEKD